MFKSLWLYRGFIIGSVKREFQSKYRNSLLGAAWTIINPLAMILIYTVIFSRVMRARLPGVDNTFAYSIYLCAGVITWGLFAEITSRAQNMFLENANLLKKLSFPRLCLPVTVVINALLNFSIVFSLFTIFLIITGNFPGIVFVALLPLLAVQIIFAISLGISLGVLNVFFRDIGQFFGIFIQFWFWLTPIVYSVDILPKSVRPFLMLNPMSNLIAAYQQVLVLHQWPQWDTLWFITLLAVLFCMFGLRMFRKHSGEMVDEL
jgi:lipopolysaccharide transport system permease protein